MKRTNIISQLMNTSGRITNDQSKISDIFSNFFINLFNSSNLSGIETCLQDMKNCVTENHNRYLTAQFTEWKIKEALFMMNPLGALGPDGFLALFFQKHWHSIGQDVSSFGLEVLNQKYLLNYVNDTYITLIPKLKGVQKVGGFRLINLWNVVYKLIAKTLANQLKRVLPEIISLTQSAFIPGHLITDNIFILYETLHSLTNRCHSHDRFMATKLNMSKAYDRLE